MSGGRNREISGMSSRNRNTGRMLASALEKSTKTPHERGRTPSPAESDFSYGEREPPAREPGKHTTEPMLNASLQARNRIDLESLQLSINQIKQSQEEHMFSLRTFMQLEFQDVKASVTSERAKQHDPHPQQAQTSIGNSFVGLQEEELRNILQDVLSKVRVTSPRVLDNVEAGVPVARARGDEDETGVSRAGGQQSSSQLSSSDSQLSAKRTASVRIRDDADVIEGLPGPMSARELGLLPTGSDDTLERSYSNMMDGTKTLTTGHTQPMMWMEFQEAVEGFDPCSVYKKVLERKLEQRSVWHISLENMGWGDCVLSRHPTNWGARITEHALFTVFQTTLILINTGLMAYEANESMQAIIEDRPGDIPRWLETTNIVFNIVFAVELVFRILSLGTWFFVAPNEWGWNIFDLGVVTSSLLFDIFHAGVRVTYVRTLRIVRVFRIARIIRVLRFFRQLRQMLYSMIACLASLAWAFLFLLLTIFMFSMVCMEGVITVLEDILTSGESAEKHLENHNVSQMRALTAQYFSSLPDAMTSVLASVTGGTDWLDIYGVLAEAGAAYALGFVFYVLFVIVGVMNVLTGVFLTSANEFVDVDLIVQGQQMRIEAFCEQMINLFYEFDSDRTGRIDWPNFSKALARTDMQAYLGSLGLEPTHMRLIFELLDRDMSGGINMEEFVMGLVKLKGEAKAIDARIIQRELGMVPLLLKHVLNKFARDNGMNEMINADGTHI